MKFIDDSDTDTDNNELVMTKKELKLLRKYEKEEKEKRKLMEKYPDIPIITPEPQEYVKLKRKLDSVNNLSYDKSLKKPRLIDEPPIIEDDIMIQNNIISDNNITSIKKRGRKPKKQTKSIEDVDNDDNYDTDDSEESDMINSLKKKLNIVDKQQKKKDNAREIIMESNRLQPTIQENNNLQTIQTFGSMPDLVKPRQTQDAGRVIQNQVMNPPIDETGDIDLNKLFSSEMGNESEVVKELFSQDNIKVKTELSQNEISIISRLELQASMTQNFFLAKIIKEFETLRVSKDRKSRAEFVSSFSGIRSEQSGMTAFGKLGSIFKNDKV